MTIRSAIKENRNVTMEEKRLAVGKIPTETFDFKSMSLCCTKQGRADVVDARIILKMIFPDRIYMG
mgnify:CR=1 FL=1